MQPAKAFLSAIAIASNVAAILALRPAKGAGDVFCKADFDDFCSLTADYVVNPNVGEYNYFCGATLPACEANTVIKTRVDYVGE